MKRLIFFGIVLLLLINISYAQQFSELNIDEANVPKPQITIKPNHGIPGEYLTIKGVNFPTFSHWPINPPYPLYTVMLGDEEVYNFERPPSGSFEESFQIPNIDSGSYMLTIKEVNGVQANVIIEEGPKTWKRFYGEDVGNRLFSLIKTSDGGYICSGRSIISGSSIMWIIKLNQYGLLEWEENYDSFQGVQIIEVDDGYIVGGNKLNDGERWDPTNFHLIKIDLEGEVMWENMYGGEDYSILYSLDHSNDGRYILTGETFPSGGDRDYYVLKVDEVGKIVWDKTFSRKGNDIPYSIIKSNNGGYIVAGQSMNLGHGLEIWVIKLNEEGEQEWEESYGYDAMSSPKDIIEVDDGYVLTGTTTGFGSNPLQDMFIMKLNLNGDLLWTKVYGDIYYDFGNSIEETNDGGYIVVGSTEPVHSSHIEIYVVRTDSEGNQEWTKTYDWNDINIAYDLTILDDYFIITGYTNPISGGSSNGVVLKIADSGMTHQPLLKENKIFKGEFKSHEFDEKDYSGYLTININELNILNKIDDVEEEEIKYLQEKENVEEMNVVKIMEEIKPTDEEYPVRTEIIVKPEVVKKTTTLSSNSRAFYSFYI